MDADVTDVAQPLAVMRGEIGVSLADLGPGRVALLKDELTRWTKPWDENTEPVLVECWREEGGYLWFPRHFQATAWWSAVESWEWAEGEAFDFRVCRPNDPERGQVIAVPEMTAYLQQHHGGNLIAGTGTGKTHMGLVIAAHFGRFIGIPVYAGHMIDNWTEQAMESLGLREDQIGVVQRDRCDLGRPVTLMSIQSLLAKRYPDELYRQIGFLIGDEVPHYGAIQWRRTVGMFGAKYRLGLTAELKRGDGLAEIPKWLFGEIGHTAQRIRTKDIKPPTVVAVRWAREYSRQSYCKWKKGKDGWKMGDAHPGKYDKRLAKDQDRNRMIVGFVLDAALKGREILVFSSLVSHLRAMRTMLAKLLDPVPGIVRLATLDPPPKLPTTSRIKAGMNAKKRLCAYRAKVRFLTFHIGRDALNIPQLDTLFFATTPGNPLQPRGRLREKDEGFDRNPLMILTFFEDTEFSKQKWRYHRDTFRKAGMPIQQVTRVPPKEA